MAYDYLLADMFFLLLMGVIFYFRNDLRRKILFLSLLCLPLGFSEIFFVPFYWNPTTLFGWIPGIESFLCAFAIAGVAGGVFEFVFFKKIHPIKKEYTSKVALVVVLVTFLGLYLFINFNLVYTSTIMMFLGAITIFVQRPDLIKSSLFAAILFNLFYIFVLLLLGYFIGLPWKIWNLSDLVGIQFLGIPLEEQVWTFSFGLFWSHLYEYIRGYELK